MTKTDDKYVYPPHWIEFDVRCATQQEGIDRALALLRSYLGRSVVLGEIDELRSSPEYIVDGEGMIVGATWAMHVTFRDDEPIVP